MIERNETTIIETGILHLLFTLYFILFTLDLVNDQFHFPYLFVGYQLNYVDS